MFFSHQKYFCNHHLAWTHPFYTVHARLSVIMIFTSINLSSFFTGSQDLWVLANLSLPIVLDNLETHMQSFDDFTSNSNVSLAQLYSFARPTILELSNFTELFYDSVESDYTKSMWDDDVTLVIYLSNLSRPMTFKITVDQQDFLFLLYFFITFITYVH